MKICTVCNQTYTDNDLNYCLTDGGLLTNMTDDPPPTVMINQARTTDQTNFSNQPGWQDQPSQPNSPWQQNQPLGQNDWTPPPAPVQSWQNQGVGANTPFMPPAFGMAGLNQTLPTVSMILGILSLLLFCCYGGIFLGIPAVIVGYLGMNNANNNPSMYSGRGMAIAGMITGGLSFIAAVLWIVFAIFVNLIK